MTIRSIYQGTIAWLDFWGFIGFHLSYVRRVERKCGKRPLVMVKRKPGAKARCVWDDFS
jgi:hypothetical protein